MDQPQKKPPIKDWQERYSCGCVYEFSRLQLTPGFCPVHQAQAVTIHCKDPAKFQAELARIGKDGGNG